MDRQYGRLVTGIGLVALAMLLVLPLLSCTSAQLGPARVEARSDQTDAVLQVTPLEGSRDSTFTALASVRNRTKAPLQVFPNVQVLDDAGSRVYDWEASRAMLRGYQGLELAPDSAATLPVSFTLGKPGRYFVRGLVHVRAPDAGDVTIPVMVAIKVH